MSNLAEALLPFHSPCAKEGAKADAIIMSSPEPNSILVLGCHSIARYCGRISGNIIYVNDREFKQ